MNNTPTPRTDAIPWIPNPIFYNSDLDLVKYVRIKEVRQLETELTAVTEQLKAEQENLTKSCMRERLADEDRKYVENQRDDAFFQLAEAQEKLAAVTEQRDQYKAALQSAGYHNHELATKLEIVAEQRDKYHDYWKSFGEERIKLKTELAAVTEQLDRLAEALEQWQPIETAPKDRSFILSAHPEHGYLITRWLEAREMWDGWAIEPTHWMSLPKLTTP